MRKKTKKEPKKAVIAPPQKKKQVKKKQKTKQKSKQHAKPNTAGAVALIGSVPSGKKAEIPTYAGVSELQAAINAHHLNSLKFKAEIKQKKNLAKWKKPANAFSRVQPNTTCSFYTSKPVFGQYANQSHSQPTSNERTVMKSHNVNAAYAELPAENVHQSTILAQQKRQQVLESSGYKPTPLPKKAVPPRVAPEEKPVRTKPSKAQKLALSRKKKKGSNPWGAGPGKQKQERNTHKPGKTEEGLVKVKKQSFAPVSKGAFQPIIVQQYPRPATEKENRAKKAQWKVFKKARSQLPSTNQVKYY
jgi:hypothetical protein